MCTQITNRTINVCTRIEKDKIVVLFTLSVFFIRFSSNRMKNVTKKCKMVQHLYVNDLQYVNLCNTFNIHQSCVIIIYLFSVDKNVLHVKESHLRFHIDI